MIVMEMEVKSADLGGHQLHKCFERKTTIMKMVMVQLLPVLLINTKSPLQSIGEEVIPENALLG